MTAAQTPSARPVVTRFAPSPTGELHVGGARTALFSWAYARRHGGQFLLRFEDTDQKRSSKQAEQNILRDLHWLGLQGDNESDGIPRQSERLDHYRAALAKLKDAGHTYDDDGAVRFRMGQDVSFTDAVYGDVTVPGADLEDFVIQKADGFPTFHLAVVVDDADMQVTHVIRGQEHLANTPKHAALYDALGEPRPVWCHTPSIMNPDGSKMSKRDKAKIARKNWTSQNRFKVQDVARLAAERWKQLDPDWLDDETYPVSLSAPNARVLRLTTHLGGGVPATAASDIETAFLKGFREFVDGENDNVLLAGVLADEISLHLPEIDVADFRASGYTPDVLLNYLALLGWNPGNDVERFDRDFLAQHFDFDRIGKSNSKFDRDKLAAFSQDDILQRSPEQWATDLEAHFKTHFPPYVDKLGPNFPVFAAAYQERSKTLNDPSVLGRFFVEAPVAYNAKAVKKNLTKNEGEGLGNLRSLRDLLTAVDDWTAESLHTAIDGAWEALGGKNMGALAQPLRVALTGAAVSPEIGPTLEILGKDETLSRIDACLNANKAF